MAQAITGGVARMGQYAKIFKAYDIRGVVPDELDEAVAAEVGAGVARLTRASDVGIAHDMRTPPPPLAGAVARGVCAQGAAGLQGRPGPSPTPYDANGTLR